MIPKHIESIFANKSVILVGNSVELMNHQYGEFIDSHDVVVRFGKAIEANEDEQKAIGKKLDVWVTGDFRSRMILRDPYKSMLKDVPILFIRSRIHIDTPYEKIPQVNHSYDMYSDDEIREIYREYEIPSGDKEARRFSAGLWTIKFMCEKVQTYKSLTLIGFDFFAKYTTSKRGGNANPCSWHRPIGPSTVETHWHEQEVNIVNKFKGEGKLDWKVISNLESEVILDTKFGRF